MNYLKTILLICTCQVVFAQHVLQTKEIYQLIHRIVPQHSNRFKIEELKSTQEAFELESVQNTIVIRGNTSSAITMGLNHYLKYYCNTSVSWFADDPVEVPHSLPVLPRKVFQEARVNQRFFLNYCTFGYTMPWWKWRDWERFIDWMALNGINLPLAITGQEAVWYKVWKKLGFTDFEIRRYFTGPAHLPWHRMSNLDKWQGPLPMSWIENQEALQKRIVQRERALGMKPVLPAFAGHVPEILKQKFPNAKISRLSDWGGFPDEYRSYFLDPFDSFFVHIQKTFLAEQTNAFGTDHIYGADPFNEVKPPSWEPEYLAKVSKTIYESMASADPEAKWLMMTWIYYFEKEHWTLPRIEAFLKAVPDSKMMLLDYYCEKAEVWKMTQSFFGKPFIWCYLGNFGGNTMLTGNLKTIHDSLENTLLQNKANLAGVGSTLEGFGNNPHLFEYVFEKAWSSAETNPETWISHWADRRTGIEDANTRAAWLALHNNVYISSSELGQATLTNARPTLEGSGNWTTNPVIPYDNATLFQTWKTLLSAKVQNRNAYRYDLVNIGRQVLGNHFLTVRDAFTKAYRAQNIPALKKQRDILLGILNDMEVLTASHSSLLLGKWLEEAKKMGSTPAEKQYYEKNARTILTTWGTKAQSLNDYGNRTWAGLLKGYYAPRWKMFVEDVIKAAERKQAFDEKVFHEKVTQFEWQWISQREIYASRPKGDAVRLSQQLIQKYQSVIQP